MRFFSLNSVLDRDDPPKRGRMSDEDLFRSPSAVPQDSADSDSAPVPAPSVPPVPAERLPYTNYGLRYVFRDPKTGKEEPVGIADYEEKLQEEPLVLMGGISLEQVLQLQMENGTLRPEAYYLDDDGKAAEVINDEDLRRAMFADYNRQLEPPAEEESGPEPAPELPEIDPRAAAVLANLNPRAVAMMVQLSELSNNDFEAIGELITAAKESRSGDKEDGAQAQS